MKINVNIKPISVSDNIAGDYPEEQCNLEMVGEDSDMVRFTVGPTSITYLSEDIKRAIKFVTYRKRNRRRN